VSKDVYYQKTNKNPELAGKFKETIQQISHSKKWPRIKTERGFINSYSLLQDRFYDGMRSAGFDGFERGERGSTTEHLDVLEFKTLKESERLERLAERVEIKQEQIEKLGEQITIKKSERATVAEIDHIGRPAMLGGFNLTADEMKKLKTLAKKSVTANERVTEACRKRKAAEAERDDYKARYEDEVKKRPSVIDQLNWFGKFMAAMKRAPKHLMAVIDEIMRRPPEVPQQEITTERTMKKSYGMEL
jgi:hypothetical protein